MSRRMRSFGLASLFTFCSAFVWPAEAFLSPSLPRRGNTGSVNTNGQLVLPVPPLRQAVTPEVVDEESTAWTKKRFHNAPAFRSATILGALLAAGLSSQSPLANVPASSAAVLHTISFATWFGTVAYTTFVLGITMFKNLPRQTFGKLQAKLFPKYFSLCSVSLVLQIITLKSLKIATAKSQKALAVSLAMTLLNQFLLEPKSTRNMLDRYRMEDEGRDNADEYKALRKKFGKFHGMSSLTNLIALLGGVAHASYLGMGLVV